MLDVITIGDAMKDIFVFPSINEMEKPISGDKINLSRDEKFMVLDYGGKISVSDAEISIGGTACNVAVALAKMGLKSGIVSAVGEGSEGEEIINRLEENHVNTKYIEMYPEKKSSFSVIISYKAERSILVYHGFTPEEFILPKESDNKWFYIGPLGEDYKNLYLKLTAMAAEKNIKIAINPGSIQINDGLTSFGGLLRVAKVLFVNKEEAKKLAKIQQVLTLKEITKALLKTGVETVVVTDGRNGACAASGDNFYKIGIFPGDRLDSTGAGDAFASGFMAGLIKNEKIVTCLQMGAINSASVVGKIGAQKGLLSYSVIKSKIRDYKWPAETFDFD